MGIFRHNGDKWFNTELTTSDSNYDMGSIYADNDLIQIIAPTEKGPQSYNPGGEVVIWESKDQGLNWKLNQQLTVGSPKTILILEALKMPILIFMQYGQTDMADNLLSLIFIFVINKVMYLKCLVLLTQM